MMSFWGIFLALVLRGGWQLSFLRRIQLNMMSTRHQLGDSSKLPQTYCIYFNISVSCSIMFDSLWPHEACQVPLPMEFSRQEYLSSCHFLLQGIFPTQGLNLGLLHGADSFNHQRSREWQNLLVCGYFFFFLPSQEKSISPANMTNRVLDRPHTMKHSLKANSYIAQASVCWKVYLHFPLISVQEVSNYRGGGERKE